MEPLVSVIIPTYNRAAYLQKALQSVKEQTYQCLEIIVIDDGSTDDTGKMLENYGGQLSYFYQENRGISGARNAGIKRARGEFIAFLDSDDYWLPDKTAQQLALFKQHPEYGLVAARCASIRLDGSYREKNRPGRSGWVLEDLFKANFIRTSAAMVKQECFKNIGLFDEELRECEEYDLWLRIAAQYPMGFINKSLAVYVDNPAGVSTDSLTGRLYRLRVLEKKYLQDKIPANLYARRIADTCHYIGRHYIKRGEKEQGVQYLLKAQKLRPAHLKNIIYLFLAYFSKNNK
jgi:glycosyltransferase involved in cell wall biosynthesis